MDRSMDSIGSCSLDVDADSTDFSDTSDSLNICTPLSGKDITREFTSRIHERCQVKQITPCQKSAVILDPTSGKINTQVLSPNTEIPITITQVAKKPSYLNLACCVNGYSNLTTYDSQLRQNINKSRGASPIRPITRTALYSNNEDNFLLIPASSFVNGSIMDNETVSPDKRFFTPSKMVQNGSKDETDNANLTYYKANKNLFTSPSSSIGKEDSDAKSPKSFIQQRVERLYGPGALAQGFYSPKRTNSDAVQSSIFLERSPNRNSVQAKLFKNDHSNGSPEAYNNGINGNKSENGDVPDEQSLPVLRHLRPEFRAQLPILSPKRTTCKLPIIFVAENDPRSLSNRATESLALSPQSGTNTKVIVTTPRAVNQTPVSCIDIKITTTTTTTSTTTNTTLCQTNGAKISETAKSVNDMTLTESNGSTNGSSLEVDVNNSKCATVIESFPVAIVANGNSNMKKDGHYFLKIINIERERLLGLAAQVEKDTEMLLQNAENSDEELIGNLRSTSGKARLLASQKIKQFEGLCHNSLNQKPGEKYPTTSEDLEGFWDMVLLQVDHVDSMFRDIEAYRSNNWKKPPDMESSRIQSTTVKTTIKRPFTAKSVFGNSQQTKSMSLSSASERANASVATKSQKSAASLAAAQRREMQRKQLLELKRKNKMANSDKQAEPDIDICLDKTITS